ncbi:DCL family protein [Streptomyces europaeiscabiei]|uniref:DCL family protein n=1 Tax=Streptomyces europaeiscabiei TaxID=146819 RepID=UPI0029B55387|nr:DCL family protein [Streptomyces europaeiscabiei]MDX3589067.1 DCL family protein [Streptomyces europaeiscabiei]
MPRGITIGATRYPTKEAVRDVCRSIVQRYGIGGDVTDPDDDAFLRHLLECHPEYDLKRGDGIAHFRVIAHTDHGRRSVGLALVRLDGEVADFSWNACLTPLSHRTQVLAALRHAIADQVAASRNAALNSGQPLVCSVTGAPIPSATELHIDHAAPTFLDLAEEFIAANGGVDVLRILPDSGAGISYIELEDKALERRWQDHHQKRAVLRPVLKRVNLSDLRRTNGTGAPAP